MDLAEIHHLIENAQKGVIHLKENINDFWGGPAASSYRDALTQTIDFNCLISLLQELEREISAAVISNIEQ